jgi:hypothetical protein
MRLPPHSPSSLECEEGKMYNENMQFAQTIIHNMYKSETFTVEFLPRCRKGWCASEQGGPRAKSVDPMNIQKSEKDKGVEQQYVESQAM